MAKFTQKTYVGFNVTVKVINYDKMEMEEKTIFTNATNISDAHKRVCKEMECPQKAIINTEKIEETWICPTFHIDECFRKYGRLKQDTDKQTDIE